MSPKKKKAGKVIAPAEEKKTTKKKEGQAHERGESVPTAKDTSPRPKQVH